MKTSRTETPLRFSKISAAAAVGATFLLLLLSLVLCICGILQNAPLQKAYNEYSDLLALCQKNAVQLHDGADFLAENARLYVILGETKYRDEYFAELNVTQRRECALSMLQSCFAETPDFPAVFQKIESALAESNHLCLIEQHAMKLSALAAGEPEGGLPPELVKFRISGDEASLEAAAKRELALSMLFSAEYTQCQAEIQNCLEDFAAEVVSYIEFGQKRAQERLRASRRRHNVYVAMLCFFAAAASAEVFALLLLPLRSFRKSLAQNQPLEVRGFAECRAVAEAYNALFDEARLQNEERQEGDLDPLTGLLNRAAFARRTARLRASNAPMALLLINVDDFKRLNESYGRESCDKLLRRIAALLKARFRETDEPVRFGGNEFALLLANARADKLQALGDKIALLNEELKMADSSLPLLPLLPPASLSAGCAFSERGYSDELYVNADRALRNIQSKGGNGFCFANVESLKPKQE